MTRLHLSLIGAVAAFGIAVGELAQDATGQTAPGDANQNGQLIVGVYNSAGDAVSLEKTQFVYAGRTYCWYPTGWRGPGYYWCGYAWRRGFGWGGPVGWNGWTAGPARPVYGRPGWRRHWRRGWRHRHWRDRY